MSFNVLSYVICSVPTKSAQNESTHLQGLAQPNTIIETSAHYGATLINGIFCSSFINRGASSEMKEPVCLYVISLHHPHRAGVQVRNTVTNLHNFSQITLIIFKNLQNRLIFYHYSRKTSRKGAKNLHKPGNSLIFAHDRVHHRFSSLCRM